ncbi:hypothetical protein [Carnimonas bestiolae]|uniref:hypothetical protein n=1 Tax=Carnimonas bestiolae TaxID=3402172 RepID=UPI003EDC666B
MIDGKISFYWNDTGYYMLVGGDTWISGEQKPSDGLMEIAAFLSDDVQFSPSSVDYWVGELTNLPESRTPDGFFGMGNAHWVMMKEDKILIACEYVKELRVLVTLEQLLYIFKQYKSVLESGIRDIDLPPEPIEVPFIAESEEATKMYVSIAGNDDDVSCIGMTSGET